MIIYEGRLKTRFSSAEVVSVPLKAYIPLFIKVYKNAMKIGLMAVYFLKQ